MRVNTKADITTKGRGFTLVEIMIVIALVASLAVLAIPNLIRARMTANESAARATLKTIAVALETYAAKSGSGYPTDFSVLTTTEPPYLNSNYIAESPVQGYNYICDSLTAFGYNCRAIPQACKKTGSKIFMIVEGAVFSEADCS